MAYSTLQRNLTNISGLIDGFLLLEANQQYSLRGAKLLGIWAEHFLYETLRTDLPHVALARPVMQFLIRSHKPHVQAKALEMELYGHSHALRYAINDLCRNGFLDLMGTCHIASFEPGRSEIFLHVNLPRLYRQKLQFDWCENVLRNGLATDARLSRDATTHRFLPQQAGIKKEFESEDAVPDKFAKMELGFVDALAFSLLYVRAVARITDEEGSREANSLLEFFGRNPIPDDHE